VAWQLRSILLIGAFSDSEHGSGIGDCMDGGGHCPEKGNCLTPLGRLSRLRQPGLATLNSTERG
jgi:hypothetical protein